MSTTLRWLIENSPLENLRCAACPEKLDSEIIGVNILDNPDTVKWIKSNELVLTSGYLYRENEEQLVRLVRELSHTGCCAVGLKTRRYYQTIPEAMIREAEAVGLPLIELPFFYSFSDIIRVVYEHIFSQKTAQQRREHTLLSLLTGSLFSNGSLTDMLSLISRQYRASVLCVNAQGIRVASAYFPGVELQLPDRFEPGSVGQTGDIFVYRGESNTYQFLTILLKGGYGALLFHTTGNSLRRELTALQHAAGLVSVKLEQRRFERYHRESAGDGFMQMLNDPTEEMTEEEIIHICEIHGFDPAIRRICLTVFYDRDPGGETFAVLASEVSGFCDPSASAGSMDPGYSANPEISTGSARRLRSYIAQDTRQVCIFLLAETETGNPELQASAGELAKQIAELHTSGPLAALADHFHISIGQCHQTPGTLPHSLEECRSLLDMLKSVFPENRIFSSADGLPYQLLNQVPKNQLREVYLNTVAVLARHDAVNHTELLKTLDMLFQCRFNVQQAAKKLYIHRNTMINRVNKIKELLHCDLQDISSSVNIYLGLCVYRILNQL